MKKLLLILSFFVFVTFCSDIPDPNLKLSNPESFAFDIGDSWEVNASVKATGFLIKMIEEEYTAKLKYSVDLIDNKQDTLKSVFSNSVFEKKNEIITDIILEAQLEIDTTFEVGQYKLVFNVEDDYFPQSKSIIIDFELSK